MKNYFSQNQKTISKKENQKESQYDGIIDLFIIIVSIVTAYSANSLPFSLKKILSCIACIMSIILMIKRYYDNKETISQNQENNINNQTYMTKFSTKTENFNDIKNKNDNFYVQKNNIKKNPSNFVNNDFLINNIKNNNKSHINKMPKNSNINFINSTTLIQQKPSSVNNNIINFNNLKIKDQIMNNNKNNIVTNNDKDKLYTNNMITPGCSNDKNINSKNKNLENSGDSQLSNPFVNSINDKKQSQNIQKNSKISSKNDNSPINVLTSEENNEKYPENMKYAYNQYYYYKKYVTNCENLESFNSEKLNFKQNEIEIPSELIDDKNFENYANRLKYFIGNKLLNSLIDKNEKNLTNLNKILEIFEIKIISNLTNSTFDDNYLDTLNEKLKYINSDIFGPFTLDKSKNILTERLLQQNYDSSYDAWQKIDFIKKKTNQIFYGDNDKIKKILNLVNNKLRQLKGNEINIVNISDDDILNPKTEYFQKIYTIINTFENPFLNSFENKKDNYDNYMIKKENLFSLTILQYLLIERLIINDIIYPTYTFYIKNIHLNLILYQYIIQRLYILKNDFTNYRTFCGGNFFEGNWCTLLPTDSQLICNLTIKYIENIYKSKILDNNFNFNRRKFFVNFPNSYVLEYNNDVGSFNDKIKLIIYQINKPEVVPIYYVAFNNKLIPCPIQENLFMALAVYFYLLKSKDENFANKIGISFFLKNLVNDF